MDHEIKCHAPFGCIYEKEYWGGNDNVCDKCQHNHCKCEDCEEKRNADKPVKKKPLSWKDVLYPHSMIGHLIYMEDFAIKLGYKYFCWNNKIYLVDKLHTSTDTGYTIDDVE